MKVLHVAALNMKQSSGPTYSVPSYVKAQNKLDGVKSDLLISIKTDMRNEQYFYIDDFKSKEALLELLKRYDIVIFHSNYIINHVKIAKLLKLNGIPYVIVPRGGFTKGSKNIKKWKKKLADILIFNKFFNSPDAIQFLTNMERDESVHKTSWDFILPNGINVPKINKEVSIDGDIKIVFIGRLDIYHKGLDMLVEAISLNKPRLIEENVFINLYGPDIRNSKRELLQMIKSYGIENIIEINGAVFEKDKTKVLCNADIFIQTSRFEGLPMGVLEALSLGVPCILTPGTNLSSEVKDYNAGIEVMLNPNSISNGIIEMIENIKNNNELSQNAISLAKKYSWNNIAKDSIKKYKEILKKRLSGKYMGISK
jgi:glycosyltransferase involved in cell wall biosynthesis